MGAKMVKDGLLEPVQAGFRGNTLCYNDFMSNTTSQTPALPPQQDVVDEITRKRRRNIIIVVSIGGFLFVAYLIISVW